MFPARKHGKKNFKTVHPLFFSAIASSTKGNSGLRPACIGDNGSGLEKYIFSERSVPALQFTRAGLNSSG